MRRAVEIVQESDLSCLEIHREKHMDVQTLKNTHQLVASQTHL